MSRLRTWSLMVLAASTLALTGWSSAASAQTAWNTRPNAGRVASSTIASIPAADRSPAGRSGVAPKVKVPAGKPPTRLESANLIVGKGRKAVADDTVTVQYVLATYSSRRVIQSSWKSQPFEFTLGAGEVIPGWDKGVLGMRVGGRRELIIPPSLGYGAQSPAAGIAANDTLVFVIDLVKID